MGRGFLRPFFFVHRAMSARIWRIIAAVGGAMAVAAGAYAAHGAGEGGQAAVWLEKGARYQMYHSLALLALAVRGDGWAGGWPGQAAAALFTAGMVLFSGGLYVLALLAWPVVPLIPVGGSCFVAGWLFLGVAAWRAP